MIYEDTLLETLDEWWSVASDKHNAPRRAGQEARLGEAASHVARLDPISGPNKDPDCLQEIGALSW